MSSTHVPLTGADCFLRAFDDEIRRYHDANHVSQLVLRLGAGFSVEKFEAVLREAVRAVPILNAPIQRPWLLAPPVYRTDRAGRAPFPSIRIRDEPGAPPAHVPESVFDGLNRRFNRRRGILLCFDIVRYDQGRSGTDIAMSWLHMLFDGSGSELFLEWLDACFQGTRAFEDAIEKPADPTAEPMLFSERGERARRWQKSMDAMGKKPTYSLAGPLRRMPQDLRYHASTLQPDATEQVVKRAIESAGFLTPMLFYLAAAIRAHHAVFRMRNDVPPSYVVPLPANARKKGTEGPIFRTHVSLLWFQLDSEIVDDFEALISELKKQRQQAIRNQCVEDALCAMDFARYAPQRLYAYMARRGFRGELATFFFAYTGEFASGLTSFLGADITNGFHAAPVPPSPGSSLAFCLRGGRLNTTHLFQHGVMTPDEHEVLERQLQSDLLG